MRKFVYQCELTVRWRDMDAFGHVNNSVYFTYFEQARALWWQKMGWMPTRPSQGPVIITAKATFLQALIFPQLMTMKLFAHSVGRSSYIIDYELYRADQPSTIATSGETKVVWIDYAAQKSLELPSNIRQALMEGH